jgi:hypothetical protein
LIRILIQIERTGVICRARKRARNIALFRGSKFCNGLQHGCRNCQGNVAENHGRDFRLMRDAADLRFRLNIARFAPPRQWK